MSDMAAIVEKLCRASEREYYNPYDSFAWPETLDMNEWYMSPQFISIYATPTYAAMTEEQRKRLSFFEAVNFFSLNIHGEKSLIEGLAKRLYAKDSKPVSPYLHHFLDEENKHMIYFGGFCMRYANKIYPDRKMVFDREYAAGEEDFLFFTKVMIFEEIVDYYNVKMGVDENLNAVSREINMLHHRDEARHLVFGRKVVAELFDKFAPNWSAETLQGVREYIEGYWHATWKEYYNPAVYKDADLPDAYDLQKTAMAHEACRAHRTEVSKACLKFLCDHDILTNAPGL